MTIPVIVRWGGKWSHENPADLHVIPRVPVYDRGLGDVLASISYTDWLTVPEVLQNISLQLGSDRYAQVLTELDPTILFGDAWENTVYQVAERM